MQEPVTRAELLDVVCLAFGDEAKPNKEMLLEAARVSGARDDVLGLLGILPSDRRFLGSRDLWEELPPHPPRTPAAMILSPRSLCSGAS